MAAQHGTAKYYSRQLVFATTMLLLVALTGTAFPMEIQTLSQGESRSENSWGILGKGDSLRNAIARSKRSVAVIQTDTDAVGTGFTFGDRGYVLTSLQLVARAKQITATFVDSAKNREDFPMMIVYANKRSDLALLLSEGKAPSAPPLHPASDNELLRGDSVVAIGCPGLGADLFNLTATHGVITNPNKHSKKESCFQTTTTYHVSNLGSPVLNKNGGVIGVITSPDVEGLQGSLVVQITAAETLTLPRYAWKGKLIDSDLVQYAPKEKINEVFAAARGGDWAAVKSLVKEYADLAWAASDNDSKNVPNVDKRGFTLLHAATKQNDMSLYAFLISNGGSLFLKDLKGDNSKDYANAMYKAAKSNARMAARTVSKAKTNLGRASSQNRRSAAFALEDAKKNLKRAGRKQAKAKNFKREVSASSPPVSSRQTSLFFKTCERMKLGPVASDIEHNPMLMHAHGPSSENTLHIVSSLGFNDALNFLILRGLTPNDKDSKGRTPLHMAALNDKEETFRLLILNGGDSDIRDNQGNTLLHFAAQSGSQNILKKVLGKKDYGINTTNRSGATPLHAAARAGQSKTAALLIKSGANVHAATKKGFTALYRAAENGHLEVVTLLLEKGADAEVLTKNRVSPTKIAEKNGHTLIVELLTEHILNN